MVDVTALVKTAVHRKIDAVVRAAVINCIANNAAGAPNTRAAADIPVAHDTANEFAATTRVCETGRQLIQAAAGMNTILICAAAVSGLAVIAVFSAADNAAAHAAFVAAGAAVADAFFAFQVSFGNFTSCRLTLSLSLSMTLMATCWPDMS